MIRARIDAVQHEVRTKARETVRWTHYYLTVYRGDVLINADDCRDWQKLVLDAEKRVIKYRDMENRGITLRPWRELVEQATF